MGLLLMGCGSLMFALPHFVIDDYLPSDSNLPSSLNSSSSSNKFEFCDANSAQVQVNEDDKLKAMAAADKLANYKYFFIFGQILHGIGAAPLVTLGTTLLDESVSRVASPMYIGIFQVKKTFQQYYRFFLTLHIICYYRHFLSLGLLLDTLWAVHSWKSTRTSTKASKSKSSPRPRSCGWAHGGWASPCPSSCPGHVLFS